MAMALTDQVASLSGRIGAEEAQDLMDWLRANPDGQIDLSACEHLHAAALQCLLALKPVISSPSSDPWLQAVLNGGSPASDSDSRNKETAT